MAKGVVMCPVINSSIESNIQNIINYGVTAYDTDYYCIGYQSSSETLIPVIYAGLANNMGCVIAYGPGYDLCNMAAAKSYVDPVYFRLSQSGTVAGLNYYYNTGYLNIKGKFFPRAIMDYDSFDSVEEMAQFISDIANVSISYTTGSIAVAGPKFVSEGSQVRVLLSIPKGVTVSESDITVKKSGVAVSFTYSNGILTFTA